MVLFIICPGGAFLNLVFFAFDRQLNYQYKAFGIPSLGFKRGLREELVVSPYSSFLALKFDYPGVVKKYHEIRKPRSKGGNMATMRQ